MIFSIYPEISGEVSFRLKKWKLSLWKFYWSSHIEYSYS